MKHLSWDDVWMYLDHELAEEQVITLMAHAEECSECREKLRKANRTSSVIAEAFAFPEEAPPENLSPLEFVKQANVLEGVTKTPRKSRRMKGAFGSFLAGALGTAAAVAIGVSFLNQSHSPVATSKSEVATTGGPGQQQGAGPSHKSLLTNSGTTTQYQYSAAQDSEATTAQSASGAPSLVVSSATPMSPVTQSFAVQSTDGSPLAGAQIYLVANGTLVGKGTTDASGVTKPITYSPIVDPVLEPYFMSVGKSSGEQERGTVTVIVVKSGYQTLVNFDTWVFPNQSGTSTFSLAPQTSLKPVVNVQDGGFHQAEVAAYVNWVEKVAPTVGNINTTTAKSSVQASVQVKVVDENRKPVEGARVVILANQITGMGVTDTNGSSPLMKPGTVADNRTLYQGMSDIPRYVNMVVYKPGYSAWAGLYLPVQLTSGNLFDITLTSIASQKANHDNHVGDPRNTTVSSPSLQMAESLVNWAIHQ